MLPPPPLSLSSVVAAQMHVRWRIQPECLTHPLIPTRRSSLPTRMAAPDHEQQLGCGLFPIGLRIHGSSSACPAEREREREREAVEGKYRPHPVMPSRTSRIVASMREKAQLGAHRSAARSRSSLGHGVRWLTSLNGLEHESERGHLSSRVHHPSIHPHTHTHTHTHTHSPPPTLSIVHRPPATVDHRGPLLTLFPPPSTVYRPLSASDRDQQLHRAQRWRRSWDWVTVGTWEGDEVI